MELVLKELDGGITAHHHVLKLLDLALELGDQSTPALELVPQLDSQV